MSTRLRAEDALPRLMQLISPSMPIGAYSYSQGIEWAVEAGWIGDSDALHRWLEGLLDNNLLYLELPVFKRMLEAWTAQDLPGIEHWNRYLLASRETFELRQEELQRARAFYELLVSLEPRAAEFSGQLKGSQTACYSFACHLWAIDYDTAAQGFVWSWLENQVLSAVKIIPLGQTAGQQLIFELAAGIPEIVRRGAGIPDHDIGASSMAMAIASARHETQYTRLFRS